MKILFVGDTHGEKHLGKVRGFLDRAGLSSSDALVHCGDIGVAWAGEEDAALRFWRGLPNKVLVCLGNHENYNWLAGRPLIRRYGALGYDLGGRVFAPLHGKTARLGGKTLWFYPGGFSVDYPFRLPGRSIHREELLERAAAEVALGRLLKRGHVDFLVSHDGPRSFVTAEFGFPISQPPASYWNHLGEEPGSRAHPGILLDEVYRGFSGYGKWYFGHHHRDVARGRLRCLWDTAVLEDTLSGEASDV